MLSGSSTRLRELLNKCTAVWSTMLTYTYPERDKNRSTVDSALMFIKLVRADCWLYYTSMTNSMT